MRMGLLILFLCPLFLKAQLTVPQIMQDQKWIGTSPSQVFWNYNSKSIYFMWNPDNNNSDSAYQYDLSNHKIEKLSYTDKQLARDISFGNYNTAKTKIAFIHDGDVFLLNVATGKMLRITQTTDEENSPAFLKDDNKIVYQLNDDLYAWDASTGATTQLTHFVKKQAPSNFEFQTEQQKWLDKEALQTSSVMKSRKEKADATKEFLKEHKDEKTLRTIYTGNKEVQNLMVSPDERFVTYNLYERNEDAKLTKVPTYVTTDGYVRDMTSRPKVGRPDDWSALYVFDKLKDTVIKVSTDSIPYITQVPEYKKHYSTDDTLPVIRKVVVQTVSWNDAGTYCIVDIFSLDNKDRWIMQLDPSTGALTLINHQHDEAWIAGPGIAWLDIANIGWINNNTIYYQSEVTGYSHLYAYNLDTRTGIALTNGKYEIQKAVLSKDKKYFYLITNEESPALQNIYRINVDGSEKIKLTSFKGGYEMNISPDGNHLAFRYSYQIKPWELYLQDLKPKAKPQQLTDKSMSAAYQSYAWRDTKIFTIKARDGADVYARMYEPKPGTKNNAAVIFVHGAGYLQNVDYWWSYYTREMMFNNLLADKGYTVLDIDYRGSAGYGRDWRTGIYRYMGGKDLDDEVDAARYLVKNLGIDSSRIGMYGGSYGGFMTLMAMFTAPDVFKAGAALRPVTDWAHYDHDYTSAILNEPFTDSIAYARSSPINFAAGLKNHLLICHGMVDMNVAFQDAVRLTQRLIELGKDNWQIAPYPVEDHGFVEPGSWTDEYKRILKLFDDNLLK
ncbi:MAG: prolyl oligopeptidase family serine peptidase [Bacteroidetes bacterium]|nr:prolyl oligopeptidase family serine peptidase [Bacteroidota bacterium]